MNKIACAALAILFCASSCATQKGTREELSTWQQARDSLLLKAKAQEYDYIIDNMLARGLVDAMISKHGADNWRGELQKNRLESLPFYFRWLKNCDVRTTGGKVFLTGQAGCYAAFVNVEGRYLLLDVGQHITSM